MPSPPVPIRVRSLSFDRQMSPCYIYHLTPCFGRFDALLSLPRSGPKARGILIGLHEPGQGIAEPGSRFRPGGSNVWRYELVDPYTTGEGGGGAVSSLKNDARQLLSTIIPTRTINSPREERWENRVKTCPARATNAKRTVSAILVSLQAP